MHNGATTTQRGPLRWLNHAFGAVSGSLLLAIIATLPIVQFIALGYLLLASKRLVKTGRLSEAFVGVKTASRVGQWLLGSWLVSLPWRFASSLHEDAKLIDPAAPSVHTTGYAAMFLGAAALATIVLATLQGGQLGHFLRPFRAARHLLRQSKRPGAWLAVWRTWTSSLKALRFGAMFSLGVRGYLATALLLAVPTTFIAAGRTGPLMIVGIILLVGVLLYLPYLQIHFAANNQLASMFDVRSVEHGFARAPLAHLIALACTLTLALPLYLLKIELVPRDALWLPAMVFIITIFPTKIVCAWAYRRGLRRQEPAHWAWRWLARLLMLPIASIYAGLVFLTQYTGWHGLLGLYEHHAFLLPVPF